jgi:hypothetical protein
MSITVFKFVTDQFLSPTISHIPLDYSGPYPKVIEEPNYDPESKGQCAAGIHVIPFVEKPDFTNVLFHERAVIGTVEEEDVIYSGGDGKMRVKKFTVVREASREEMRAYLPVIAENWSDFQCFISKFCHALPDDEARDIVCRFGNAHTVAWYALQIDKEPRDDTRQAACSNGMAAFSYAVCVDQKPRDDTRTAACKSPSSAYDYACRVDGCPRSDTRKAACADSITAFKYALNVDGAPHRSTRAAANKNESTLINYANQVDKFWRADTARAAKKFGIQDQYEAVLRLFTK